MYSTNQKVNEIITKTVHLTNKVHFNATISTALHMVLDVTIIT